MKISINPGHRETLTIDGASFVIRPLSGGDMLEASACGDSGKASIAAIEFGVVSWSSVIDHEGKPVQRSSGVRVLPKSALETLLVAIMQLSRIDSETEKNSA